MTEFFSKLLVSDFMPHGHCYLWQKDVLWTHVLSDAGIALAYFSIPVLLVHFVRKREDLAFNWMFLLFGLFIFSCGATHLMSIWTVWYGTYRLDGVVKAVTAASSLLTAALLVPTVPKALALPSPARLRAANEELEAQVERTRSVEAEVRRLNAELERRVEERTAALRRSNEQLQRFAYVASHDLQEPLRTVGSFTQLLARRFSDRPDPEAQEFVGYITGGIARMHQLINGLLDYSRLETEAKPFEIVEMETVADIVLENLEMAIRESGAVVTREPLPRLMADPTQMVQLLQNLVGNAIKYRSEEPPVIHLSVERTDHHWTFSVRDNGIGIEPRHAERVFEIYQRLHGADRSGAGIGLAICKRIVERHGGRIWVEAAAAGGGSVFRFTIPRRAEGDRRAVPRDA